MQHSMGRAIAMKAAASRERKPMYNYAIAAKNVSKLEARQLAVRLLVECLLAMAIRASTARLFSVISSQVSWIDPGSRMVSVSSWVPQGPTAPPVLARSDGDPLGSSEELGEE